MSLAAKIARLRKELGATTATPAPTAAEREALEAFAADSPAAPAAGPLTWADVPAAIVEYVRTDDANRRAALATALRARGFDT